MKDLFATLFRLRRVHVVAILKSFYYFPQEVYSAFKYKVRHYKLQEDDAPVLHSYIKKRAHHVEKVLFYPDRHEELMAKSIHDELTHALRLWREKGHPRDPVVGWAEKIAREYENVLKGGTACPNHCNLTRFKNRADIRPEEFMKLLRSRRSLRNYQKSPLTEEEKVRLTEAALWAPNACNRQTLKFLFVEDDRLKRLVAHSVPGGNNWFDQAPCIIVVLADKRDYRFPEERVTPYQDAAAAMQNLLLMGEALNLACCWGSFTSFGSVRNEAHVRKELNIAEHYLITGAIAAGHRVFDVCLIPRDPVRARLFVDRLDTPTHARHH